MRSLDVVQDQEVIKQLRKDIETLEKDEDGFNRYIRKLMTYQLPQPPNNCWA
jgi:hypothetical protein